MNPYYNPTIPSVTPTPSGNIRTSISNPYLVGQGGGSEDSGNDWWDENGNNLLRAGIGGAALVGDLSYMSKQGLGLSGRELPGTNSYSGDYFNQAYNAHIQHTSGGEIAGNTLKGAAAGASLGPLGAAIGAGIGLFGTVFAGNRRRRRQAAEKQDALNRAVGYQNAYNTAQNFSDQQATSAADYQRRIDKYTQNLYSWNAT